MCDADANADHDDGGIYWDDDHHADDEDSFVVSCPHCGAPLYEDAEQCPGCGDYVVHRSGPWQGKPSWWVLLGMAGIGAVIWLLLRSP